MSYSFLDAAGSVQLANSSVIGGGVQMPIVNIGSVLTPLSVTFSGSPSISGAVTIASTVAIGNSPSVFAAVSGSVISFEAGTQRSSVFGMRNDAVASFLGADLTVRPISTDSAGRTLVKPFAPEESAVRGIASTVGTSVTAILPVAGAGLRNYITDIIAVNTGATTAAVNLRDSDASILTRIIVPTGGGSNIPGLVTPIRTGSLNSQVDMVSLTASSIITITLLGYKAP